MAIIYFPITITIPAITIITTVAIIARAITYSRTATTHLPGRIASSAIAATRAPIYLPKITITMQTAITTKAITSLPITIIPITKETTMSSIII